MRPGADCSACRSATSSTRCKLKLKPCSVTLRTEEASPHCQTTLSFLVDSDCRLIVL